MQGIPLACHNASQYLPDHASQAIPVPYANTTPTRCMRQALAKRFEGLEPLAKARALLAGTFMRAEALTACRPQLQSIAEQVRMH